MDKQILLDNYISRRNLLNNFLNKRETTINPMSNRTLNQKISRNPFEIKLPNITSPNYTLDKKEEEKNFEKNLYIKKHKLKLRRILKKEKTESENQSLQK